MNIREIKKFFKKYNLKPQKYLGQNFLVNEKFLEEIVKISKINKNDIVLEIGPGIGNLTEEILKKNPKKLILVEKDKNFIKILNEKFKKDILSKKIILISNDILKIDFKNLKNRFLKKEKDPKNFKIIGNLPYYLTSRLLKKFFESKILAKKIVLTLQKEVAQRICKKPPNLNLLALSVQIFAKVKIVKYVKKTNFWPKPKVDSAIIEILPYQKSKYLKNKKEIDLFFKITKTSFFQKRKQIINTLSKFFNLDKKTTKKILNSLKIDEKSRPQSLSIKNWLKLVLFLEKNLLK